MGDVVSAFDVRVEQQSEFEFTVRFDKEQFASLRMDEPPPLGHDVGPNAARVLAAAVGNCLSASLVFCAKKAGKKLEGVRTSVHVEIVRNEQRRLRVGKIRVHIDPGVPVDDAAVAGCLATFEDFCMVTQSVRAGVDVEVEVGPANAATP
jgi:uncharacterized OsmC-like protein